MTSYEEWRRDNWDRAHIEGDVSALTGTSLHGHLATLHAGSLFVDNVSLLCIGVGTGHWVKEAFERTKDIWCLDVSSHAQKNLPSDVKFTLDPTKLPSSNFDLALSLWVAPHMSNYDLQTQMNEVVRSLKKDGVFAIHYKEPLDPTVTVDNLEGTDDEWKVARRAGMLRRRGHFKQMAHWANGNVVFNEERPSEFHQIVEVCAHITRRN